MNNTFSRNVVVCSNNACYKSGKQNGGFYVIGMTNDFIENRIVGYNLGFFSPGAGLGHGQGLAAGRVCPKHLPFGIFRGNVNHDCERFGLCKPMMMLFFFLFFCFVDDFLSCFVAFVCVCFLSHEDTIIRS